MLQYLLGWLFAMKRECKRHCALKMFEQRNKEKMKVKRKQFETQCYTCATKQGEERPSRLSALDSCARLFQEVSSVLFQVNGNTCNLPTVEWTCATRMTTIIKVRQ